MITFAAPFTKIISTMSDSKEKELLYGIVSLMLPESMLDCFDIVKVAEEAIPRTDASFRPYKRMVNLYLDERDNRTEEQQSFKPNGFTEYTRVTDFPLRNRLVTLHIRRRRYIDTEGKNTVLCEYPLKAEGTSISPEFADFLKGAPR